MHSKPPAAVPTGPKKSWKQAVRETARRFGYDVSRYSPDDLSSLSDLTEKQREIVARARPFCMTSLERMAAMINAVTHITTCGIEGDIAECGVWRGGSMMLGALTLLAHGDTSRELYLYDTFEGMPPPTDADKNLRDEPADVQLEQEEKGTGVWCYAGIEEVTRNILATGYPKAKIHLIKGKVEDTIPSRLPGRLAMLRLDTDWYESTKHELDHMYPLLNVGGVLIIDDYGHWQGAKLAVDEYFRRHNIRSYLHRIDYTGRLMIKEK